MPKEINFNPNEHQLDCERYLSKILEGDIRFIQAEELPKSTRDPGWRLDVEVDGNEQSYV